MSWWKTRTSIFFAIGLRSNLSTSCITAWLKHKFSGFWFQKKLPEFVCTRHLFDFVSRRECANSKEAFIFKSAYFVSKIQPLDNNDFISNNEKKTATLNWEVFSVRRITNLRAVSLLASSMGSLRVGKDWRKGRSSPSPLFSPAPCRAPARPHPSEQHPLAGESLVNQSQSINISVTYKDAPDSILLPRRKDYPGYLGLTRERMTI